MSGRCMSCGEHVLSVDHACSQRLVGPTREQRDAATIADLRRRVRQADVLLGRFGYQDQDLSPNLEEVQAFLDISPAPLLDDPIDWRIT